MTSLSARLVELPCAVLHRLWWVPIWNRSALLGCPIAWLCHHNPRFDRWYWRTPA